jgi:hypothetical protein
MPKAMQHLPTGYELTGEINLNKNTGLVWGLNLAGLVLFLLVGLGMTFLIHLLRPEVSSAGLSFSTNSFNVGSFFGTVALLILALLGIVILHEAIHGLGFWWVTGSRPKFGFKGVYAYAAAPEWYLPKHPYLGIGLAPLLVITTVGIILMVIGPASWINATWFVVTLNAAGSIGDLFAVVWLLTKPRDVRVRDFGDRISVYQPPGITE